MTIVFIGAGNLATSFSAALQHVGHSILQVYSRTDVSAHTLAMQLDCPYTTKWDDIRPDADIYIYALSDTCYPLQTVAQGRGIHLLTSGSISYTALQGAQHAGVFYPFQTFSKTRPLTDFSSIPVLIEASDSGTLNSLQKMAESLSAKAYVSNLDMRSRLHLAGVMANNFTNCLYALAEEQLQQAGLPFEILLPLIDETAAKVHILSPRQAQTGPARRADRIVIQKQLELLNDEKVRQLYCILSDNIIHHA